MENNSNLEGNSAVKKNNTPLVLLIFSIIGFLSGFLIIGVLFDIAVIIIGAINYKQIKDKKILAAIIISALGILLTVLFYSSVTSDKDDEMEVNVEEIAVEEDDSIEETDIEESTTAELIENEETAAVDNDSTENKSNTVSARVSIIDKPDEDDIISVSRVVLHNNADDYVDKWVRIVGQAINEIENDEGERYVIMPGVSDLKNIYCYLMSDQPYVVGEGTYVTIVGKVESKLIGQVSINNCYIENVGDESKELDESLSADDPISSGGTSVFGSADVDRENAIEVTAREVYNEMQENQVACKNKYNGKVVALTGIVDDIGTNVFGQEYVTFDVGNPYSLEGVQCFFKNDQLEYVGSLSKGDQITLYGYAEVGSMTFKMSNCQP